MGQYHYVCNLDRREYLHPHRFGDGLKLMEFGDSSCGTMLGLAILLACSNGRGGGDLHIDASARAELLGEHIVGRWAGERIAIIGDYAEDEDFPGFLMADSPWVAGRAIPGTWIEISPLVIEAMRLDHYVRDELQTHRPMGDPSPPLELTDTGKVVMS